ncbi:MAG: two-component sensor histidine kinase, partial [Bradyrhizobium sp.]|nr:two-component sensor histidine kinase [Bradyrhizobium sp.]
MSGVIVVMRQTLLSCTSLARKGLLGLAATALAPATPGFAGNGVPADAVTTLFELSRQDVAEVTAMLALLGFSVVAAVALVRTRLAAARKEARLRADVAALQLQADRYRALLFAEPQILIAWPAGGHRPQISGDT